MTINFDKYTKVPLKLSKLQDIKFNNNHPNEINEGHVVYGILHEELSKEGQCFFILDGPDRYFHTSHVQKIEEREGYDLVYTLNSIYKVEMQFSGLTGVQEKHSVKVENTEGI